MFFLKFTENSLTKFNITPQEVKAFSAENLQLLPPKLIPIPDPTPEQKLNKLRDAASAVLAKLFSSFYYLIKKVQTGAIGGAQLTQVLEIMDGAEEVSF